MMCKELSSEVYSIHDSLRNIHVGMYHVCAKPWSIVLCFEHIFAVSVDRLTCSLDMFLWLRIGVLVGASEEFCSKNINNYQLLDAY